MCISSKLQKLTRFSPPKESIQQNMQILDMFLILNFTTYHCTFPCNKKYAYRFLHETIDACNKMFGIGKLNRVNACYLKYIFEGEQMTHE